MAPESCQPRQHEGTRGGLSRPKSSDACGKPHFQGPAESTATFAALFCSVLPRAVLLQHTMAQERVHAKKNHVLQTTHEESDRSCTRAHLFRVLIMILFSELIIWE